MRKLLALFIVVAAAGCQRQPVTAVPTTDELMKNSALLAEWKAKCETGEYSHLPANQKDNFCFTTREAGRSVAIKNMNGL